jgi:hypothetical protein
VGNPGRGKSFCTQLFRRCVAAVHRGLLVYCCLLEKGIYRPGKTPSEYGWCRRFRYNNPGRCTNDMERVYWPNPRWLFLPSLQVMILLLQAMDEGLRNHFLLKESSSYTRFFFAFEKLLHNRHPFSLISRPRLSLQGARLF